MWLPLLGAPEADILSWVLWWNSTFSPSFLLHSIFFGRITLTPSGREGPFGMPFSKIAPRGRFSLSLHKRSRKFCLFCRQTWTPISNESSVCRREEESRAIPQHNNQRTKNILRSHWLVGQAMSDDRWPAASPGEGMLVKEAGNMLDAGATSGTAGVLPGN